MINKIALIFIAMTAAPAMADETSTDRCHWLAMNAAVIAEKRDEGIPLTSMLETVNDWTGFTDLALALYKNRDITPSEAYTALKDGCELELEQSQ